MERRREIGGGGGALGESHGLTGKCYKVQFVQIGGSRNSLALDADGQILSWGWNARATLGLGHG